MSLAQYSFSEFTSKMSGQVFVCVHRARRPSVLPVTGS